MRLRLLSVPVRVLATAVCALATHALMYRTLWPSDAVHGYLGWYEPLVGALSLASLIGLVALVAVAPATRRPGLSFHLGARSLAYSTLAFVLAQETLERSLEAGRIASPALAPEQWIALVAGVAATAFALAVAVRGGGAVVRRILGAPPAQARSRRVLPGWSLATVRPHRLRPLADRFALRAPPLGSS